MKTRQFKQLAGLPRAKRVPLVVEGLTAIGANIAKLVEELEQCNEAEAYRSARLAHNVAREEAGKFLVLVDAYRASAKDQAMISRQFARAGDHLSKLLYAQMADYSIGSRKELHSAVTRHRQALYLDGPNGCDWVFRNDLLSERESALYVDLVDSEGALEWWTPHDYPMGVPAPASVRLVQALLTTGLVSPAGFQALQDAWRGFDPLAESHCWEWAERTRCALHAFPDENVDEGHWTGDAGYVADHWPMPLVQFDLDEAEVTVDALVSQRQQRYETEMMEEYGPI